MNPLKHLQDFDIILGSASPRRKELLDSIKIPYTILTSEKEEIYDEQLDPSEVPAFLSRMKYDDILTNSNIKNDYLLITADTIVIVNNEILGKPANNDEAREMLHKLSNTTHQVLTGVTIGTKENIHTFTESTLVTIEELSSDEIQWYSNNFDILDKAGAYGIQDWLGTTKVKNLEGTYYNVMGLPVNRIYSYLMQLQ